MYSILVVDDEETVREGIVRFLTRHGEPFKIVGSAEDGQSALEEVEKLCPDIIITDINMPRMNGLDFIENIHELDPNVKIVIISGYDDFTFAQKALQFGVSDYLLKPIEKGKLIKVLLKLCESIAERRALLYDHRKLELIARESIPAVRERYLWALVNGSLNKDELRCIPEYYHLDISGKLFAISLLRFCNGHGDMKKQMAAAFINNCPKDIFDDKVHVTAFFYNFNDIAILLCSETEDRPVFFRCINRGMSTLVAYIKREFYPNIKISVGTIEEDIAKLGESFQHALDTLPYVGFFNNDTIVNYQDFNSTGGSELKFPAKLEEKLLLCIKLMDVNSALDAVRDLSEYIRALENVNRVYVKMLTYECALAALRTLNEVTDKANERAFKIHDFFELLGKCESIDEWEEYMNTVVCKGIEYIDGIHKDRHDEVVTIVQQLAESFLGNPDLSIELVAEHVYVSPNYLRQLFKQKTGKSFVEYITLMRLEKAAYLLINTPMKVQDIAELVAYNDSRYFASCFKKHFGVSPTEYRESIMPS